MSVEEGKEVSVWEVPQAQAVISHLVDHARNAVMLWNATVQALMVTLQAQ